MAFPDETKTFLRAVDPTAANVSQITTYQGYLNAGNLEAAAEYLANTMDNGPAMNINASRFNEVLDEILAIENFYLGNNGVQAYINNKITAASDIAVWTSGTQYKVGNVVADPNTSGKYYQCIQNIPSPYTTPLSNTAYWSIFLQPQEAKQYPISDTQPVGQSVGDLWFEVLNTTT